MTDDLQNIFEGLDEKQIQEVVSAMRQKAAAIKEAKAQDAQAPLIAELNRLYKMPSKNAARIKQIEKELGWDGPSVPQGYLR